VDSLITQNWRARPLVSNQTIIDSIASTKTTTGLRIKAKLTQRTYHTGVEISAVEMTKLNLKPDGFHGETVLLSQSHSQSTSRTIRTN
jgi:hypothetical protein